MDDDGGAHPPSGPTSPQSSPTPPIQDDDPALDGDGGNCPRSGRRRQDRGQSDIDSTRRIQGIVNSGRGIHRLVTLYDTIPQLMRENDRRLPRSQDDSDDDDDDGDDDEALYPERRERNNRDRDRSYQSYLELVKFVPSLKHEIANRNRDSRMLYYSWLTKGANRGSSDDRSVVKRAVADFLSLRSNNPAIPAINPKSRDERGLQNDYTGRLLCPTKYDWEDLTVRAKIRDQIDGYSASAAYWIRCLYEGEQGDPEDVEKGFLKSALLVKTFQTIFTSPSSADGDLDAAGPVSVPVQVVPRSRCTRKKAPPKRADNATLHEMNGQVTVRSIAYAAVQLHFALTDATHWMIKYNGFDYGEFYDFIVDFFEVDQMPEGKVEARKLLDWWNEKVFLRSTATRAASKGSVLESSFATLREQHRARRLSHQP